MDELIGFLVFIVIVIFGAIARWRESQRAKQDLAPPPPPKPRPQPRPGPAAKPRWQLEKRDVTPPRPWTSRGQQGARPAGPGQRPPQGRLGPQGQVPGVPGQGAGSRPAQRPQPALTDEEKPRLRPDQARTLQRQAAIKEMTAEPEGRREAPKQAPAPKIGSAGAAAADDEETRQRRLAALPPLFRDTEGIRQGVVFSEIIGPPLALRKP